MTSSPLKQETEVDQNAPTHLVLGCPRTEIGHKKLNTKVPNINLEPPADSSETTSSRNQSMNLRSLCGYNEQPSSLKADICPAVLLEQQTSSRWVKRFKVSAYGSFSVGTKSSNLLAKSSHEKANKFLSKSTKATITGAELAGGKLHGEELMVHDRTPAFARNSDFSSINVMKKDQALLTSQSWIRRLLHNRTATAQTKPQMVVVCEPQSSKLELGHLQKNQFPSVAAMALMGKSMTGFQPCEFQQRGRYVVWNTRVSETT